MNQDHNDRQESKHRTDHEGDTIIYNEYID